MSEVMDRADLIADPYNLLVYASFQERATRISHRVVTGKAAQAQDDLCRQAERYERLAERAAATLAQQTPVAFSWLRDRKV